MTSSLIQLAGRVQNKPLVQNESKYSQFGSPTATVKANQSFFAGVAKAVVEAVAKIFKAIAIWVKNLFQWQKSSPVVQLQELFQQQEPSPVHFSVQENQLKAENQLSQTEQSKIEALIIPTTPAKTSAQPWCKNGKVIGALAFTTIASVLAYRYFFNTTPPPPGGNDGGNLYGGYLGLGQDNGQCFMAHSLLLPNRFCNPSEAPKLSDNGFCNPSEAPKLSDNGFCDPSEAPKLDNGFCDPSEAPKLDNGFCDPSEAPKLSDKGFCNGFCDPSEAPKPDNEFCAMLQILCAPSEAPKLSDNAPCKIFQTLCDPSEAPKLSDNAPCAMLQTLCDLSEAPKLSDNAPCVIFQTLCDPSKRRSP